MYQVKVLSDSEFEALPYPEMDQSLGVADPSTNTAYVRYTGIGEVDKYLINHELEHLIEGHGGEHSHHYRNGVYYKGFGEVLQNVLPTVGGFFTGGPVGAGLGAAGSFASYKMNKQRQGGQEGEPNIIQPNSSGSPMESFKAPKPNIISPGGNGFNQGSSTGGNSISSMQGGGSPIERVRGFFSSRNPQGAF